MEKPSNSNFDRDLAAALAPGQRAFVPGFTDRVLGAVHADRFRRKVIRWSSVASTLAACFVAAFVMTRPSADEALIQQTHALLASDESAKLNAILGVADDLAILTPVVEKPSAVVEALATTEL
jgi:hypothetical protein